MRTARCGGSPFQLHVTVGVECFWQVVARHGVVGWNAWVRSMVAGEYMPLCWGEHDHAPPIWWWLDFEDADFSGRNLDGADLKLAWLRNANFDESSLSGSRIGCCPLASFRASDLRGTDFRHSDITAVDFSSADTKGIKLHKASFDPRCPPLGLPAELLGLCKAEPVEPRQGAGAAEFPVVIVGSLTSLSVPI